MVVLVVVLGFFRWSLRRTTCLSIRRRRSTQGKRRQSPATTAAARAARAMTARRGRSDGSPRAATPAKRAKRAKRQTLNCDGVADSTASISQDEASPGETPPLPSPLRSAPALAGADLVIWFVLLLLLLRTSSSSVGPDDDDDDDDDDEKEEIEEGEGELLADDSTMSVISLAVMTRPKSQLVTIETTFLKKAVIGLIMDESPCTFWYMITSRQRGNASWQCERKLAKRGGGMTGSDSMKITAVTPGGTYSRKSPCWRKWRI
jgi:hypothetical protein